MILAVAWKSSLAISLAAVAAAMIVPDVTTAQPFGKPNAGAPIGGYGPMTPKPATPQPGPLQPSGTQGGGVVPSDGQGTYPMLAAPNGPLPPVNVESLPGIGSTIRFGMRTSSGPVSVDLNMQDNLNAGFSSVYVMRAAAGGTYAYSGGMASLGARHVNGQSARTLVPDWSVDDARVGGICLAFIADPGQQEVMLSRATLCVMDRGCGQTYACGRLR